MSKTVTFGQESWPQDTPLLLPTSTTSDTVELVMTEKSTRTEGESRLLYSVVAGAVAGALVAYIVVRVCITYTDGLVKSGYFPLNYVEGGQKVTAMVPMYMTKDELRKMVGGEKQ